ncbi:Fpg/Nei family DNA glycosylase [Fodinicola feengrottensis]|uniref:DNA-(apurinic or apyrimidinic site) lyase n=1 Tax=Fodinicola feengrottensis TaxID=435914 RepID=A0ABN2I8C9_9ACTN|nr:Fpg/Nei family DNA glycosylase [Fodinicola feengrottensis]
MPEGHTIHRLAAEHRRRYGGSPVQLSSPQGRFAAGAARCDGRVLDRTEAYGKHLFHRYGADWIHIHLGLYGTFALTELTNGDGPPEPVGQVRLRMVGDGAYSDLRGPAACTLLTAQEKAAITDRLGPDPLRRDADLSRGFRKLGRSRAPIAQLLMDQSVLAGVGNVYRAEVLYRAGMDPYRPGRDLSEDEWLELWTDLVALMKAGVRTGRITTLRPENKTRISTPPRPGDGRYVYRRTGEPCRVCGTPVRTAELATRNLYWCPTCQPAV